MAVWTARAFARPRIAAIALTAIVAGSLVPVIVTSTPADAVQATGGSARFPQVQWISWGANGADLIPDSSGDITRTETMTVGGQQILVTCTIDDLTQTRATNITPPLIRAYASGQWQGDGLDELYNIGGTGTSNTLAIGIRSVKDGAHITFDFACSAQLVVGENRTPVTLAGLVLANAESSGTASAGPYGGTWEYIGATIPANGTWRIIDRVRGASCTQDNFARLTGGTGAKTLQLFGAKNGNCEGATVAMRPSPTTVAYMEGVSSATDVTLYGNGFEGVALGVVINTDFGDAPAGYGVAGAVSQGGFTGGVPDAYTSGDGQSVFGMTLAQAAPPTLRLGATVDFETTHQSTAAANGDDTNGSDDEDAVTLASSYAATPGETFTMPAVACNASASQPGYVAGWIDFNADGEFQASEKSQNATCPAGGGTVTLSFTAPDTPPTLATQPTYARLRIAPSTAELTPTGIASSGEVEDHRMTFTWPPFPSMSLSKEHTGGEVEVGDTLTYSLTFTNDGNVPLTSVVVSDPTATVSGCTWATVAAGASVSCTASKVVTEADVAAGFVLNTASATARDHENVLMTPVSSAITVDADVTAVVDEASTTAGSSVTRNASSGVLANDIGHSVTVTDYTAVSAEQGELTINGDGSYTFTPAEGFSGIVTSTYEITDIGGDTATATLTITVRPTADADSGTTQAETPLELPAATLLEGDLGTALEVTSATDGTHGTVEVDADGNVTYTPADGYSGPDTFTYTVTDAAGLTATAIVTVSVTPLTDDDSASTIAGTQVTRTAGTGVLANDLGSDLTVSDFDAIPADEGTLVINENGSYTFTPAAGFSGVVSTTYTVRDATGQTATGTLTIAVSALAVDDDDTTAAGTALTRAADAGVLSNDAGAGLTVTDYDAVPAGQGTLTISASGAYTFTPAAGFSGTVTADYTATDAHGSTDEATLTIVVSPSAVADSAQTLAGTPVTIAPSDLIDNDLGTGLEVQSATDGTHGTTTVSGAGDVTYTPSGSYSGPDSFTYTVVDAEGRTATATVSVVVMPVAKDDSGSVSANTPRDWSSASLTSNDSGTSLAIDSATDGDHGSVTVDEDGVVTYTPDLNYSGPDSFTYTVIDASGNTATATVNVHVMLAAVNDDATTASGVTLTVDEEDGVLSNDSGVGLAVIQQTYPESSQGTLSIAADGSYTFVPAPGFSGDVTVTYWIQDDSGWQHNATLTISVGVSAVDESAHTDAGATLTANAEDGVLANDLGSDLIVTGFTPVPATAGTLTIEDDGSYTFVPAAGFSGTVSSDYTIEDANGNTGEATLTITVHPVAGADSGSTTAGTPLTFTENQLINDDLGTTLSVQSATDGDHGTTAVGDDGSVTYTPDAGFSGTDTFTYTVVDADGGTATAEVTVTVRPTADADSGTTYAGEAFTWTASDLLDGDLGSDLEVTSATGGTHGTVTVDDDGAVTYTPTGNYSGLDSFTYTVTDEHGQTATATISVTVRPLVTDDSDSTVANQSVDRATDAGVLSTDVGRELEVTGYDPLDELVGELTINADGSYTFVPATGFSGTVTTTYTVHDAANLTESATLTIYVAPTAADDSATATAGSNVQFDASQGVLSNDVGSSLTVTGYDTVPSTKGELTIATDGGYVFTPAQGFSGVVTVDYTATDAEGNEIDATLTITVTPVANGDSGTLAAGDSYTWTAQDLLDDDLGANLAIDAVTDGTHGTVAIDGDGNVVYTPYAGFSGSDSFTYTIVDAEGQTAEATVVVTVTPVADNDSGTTTANTAILWTEEDLLDGDLGSTLTITATTDGLNGTVAVADDGTVTYTPATGYSGPDSFTYTVTDSSSQTATATVSVTVLPTAKDDAGATSPGATLTVDEEAGVLANDAGSSLEVVSHTSPTTAQGTLTIAADGSYVFEPADGFSGEVTVTYTVEDAAGQQATATLTISVDVTAVDDDDATTAGTAITRDADQGVLVNDLGTGLTVTGFASVGASGTLTIASDGSYSFTPAAGFSGAVSSVYTVEDASGSTATATLMITVAPLANDDSGATTANTPLTLTQAELIADDLGTDLGVVSATNGDNGIVTVDDEGAVTYTPATSFSGTDTITYTVRDAEGGEATASVTITVTPVAGGDVATTASGTELTKDAAGGVLSNDHGSSLTVISHTSPLTGQGSLTIDADGSYEFTPGVGFSGDVVVTYTVKDAEGQQTTATLTISVGVAAGADVDLTTVNQAISRDAADGVLANDSGTDLTVTEHTSIDAEQGVLAIASDGSYTFEPAEDFSGTVEVTYTMEDASGNTDTATLTITVTPIAADDSVSAATGVPNEWPTTTFLDNDSGSQLTIVGAEDGDHGTVSVDGDGNITYTPADGFSGEDSFTYTATDAEGQVTTATVTVFVMPHFEGDEATTALGVPITKGVEDGVLANDLGSDLEVTGFGPIDEEQGTLEIAADGSYEFTPAPGFSGIISTSYEVRDGSGNSGMAALVITVTPLAADDSDSTTAGTAISRDVANGVLANDSGSDLTVIDADAVPAEQGTLAIAPDGSYEFTPAAGFSGTVTVDYTVEDSSGQQETATLTIDVTPTAQDDSYSVGANTDLVEVAPGVLDNDRGAGLEVVDFEALAAGTGSLVIDADGAITYTSESGFSGIVTSEYTVRDSSGQETTATLTISVTPVANNDAATTSAQTVIEIPGSELVTNDVGSALELVAVTATGLGSVTLAGGEVTYTPPTGFSGPDTFEYTVRDASGQETTATVTMTVTPRALNDSASVNAGSTVTVDAADGLLANDLGSDLEVVSVSADDPAKGMLSWAADGSFEFEAAEDYSGDVTYTYVTEDEHGQQATATLTIQVAPLAVVDDFSTPFEVAATIPRSALSGNDLGGTLTVVSVYSATNGTLSVIGDDILFTPSPGFTGTGSFLYRVRNSAGVMVEGTVYVRVGPNAVADSDGTDAETPIVVDAADGVLANDVGQDLVVTGHDAVDPAKGELTIAGDGSYEFTPTAEFSGFITVNYTIEDENGVEDSSTLSITVAPLAKDDYYSTPYATPIEFDLAELTANDLGANLEVSSASSAVGGALAFVGGKLVYTPAGGFAGAGSFRYTIGDGASGILSTATVHIAVGALAVDDDDETPAGITLTRDASEGVLDNDLGTDIAVADFSAVDADKGTLTIASDGSYEFIPAAGFSGTVTSTYSIEDAEEYQSTAVLTITVTPVANNDSASTLAGEPYTLTRGDLIDDDLGSELAVTAVTQGANGSVELDDDGSVTYTPTAGFSGADEFTYTVTDREGQDTTATVNVTVLPNADADVASTPANTTLNRDSADGVLSNDLGTDLTVVSYDTVDSAMGELTLNPDGSFTFVPVTGISGRVDVDYTIEDAEGGEGSATLTIWVRPVGSADGVTTASGVPATVTAADLLTNDVGTDLVVTAVSTGTNGVPTLGGDGTVTFVPTEGFSGTATFTYAAEDAEGQTYSVTVTVTVTPTAGRDEDTTTGGTPISRDATGGVLGNDEGSGLQVTGHDPLDPAFGTIVINPDGSYTFTPAPGYHGTVEIPYTVQDEDGQETTSVLRIEVTGDLPLVAGGILAQCIGDLPYLSWDVALPEGFPDQGSRPLSITFVNPGGDNHVVTGLPLKGVMLWPGASKSPLQWPGWERQADGTYVETDGNFAWTRDGVTVVFEVNPQYQTSVKYPPASAGCAMPPVGMLPRTGADTMELVPWAAALIGVGVLVIVIGRRRREED